MGAGKLLYRRRGRFTAGDMRMRDEINSVLQPLFIAGVIIFILFIMWFWTFLGNPPHT